MTDRELMKEAAKIAANSRCWIGQGCIISRNGKILAEAWNETLAGEEYCQEFRDRKIKKGPALRRKAGPYHANGGCIRHELNLSQGREIEKVCSVHAEVNAIAAAARKGIAISGAAMFVTSFPCLICMRSIIAAGIKKIVYMNDFYKTHHEELFAKNGVEVQQIPEDKVWEKIKEG
jgi:deoxycytidylate deaminase